MTNNYIDSINKKREKENLKQEVIFGQTIGIIIVIICTLKYCSTKNLITSNILLAFIGFGILLFITGLVFPYILYYPSKFLKFITNKIFNLIFSIILLITYILFIIPISLIVGKKYRKKYDFYTWNGSSKNIKFNGFTKKELNYIDYNNDNLPTRIKIIRQIVNHFFNTKQYALIPIIFILIFIGLLFFFITSNIVSPMIYTIF